MKYFLLIVGDDYYPSHRTGDWIGCFETREEAHDFYSMYHRERDWYEIVDLKEWIND
jgi:hypothetical protein